MLCMDNINDDIASLLIKLGSRLKEARLDRNESQEIFAARIGLSRQAYGNMEKGSPHTSIVHWLKACDLLGRLDTWQNVLAEKEDLFAQYERQEKKRQRAGRRTGGQK